MYGLRLRCRSKEQVDLAPIQRKLPDELMSIILGKLGGYNLGRTQCVCKTWHYLGFNEELWASDCLEAFQQEPREATVQLMRTHFRGSWRAMFLERPHLRFDGLYVSRNTYIRTGVTEWRVKNPVHLVCYYRYFRFLPDGTFLYRTSPEVLVKVERSLRAPFVRSRADEGVQKGRYLLLRNRLFTSMPLGNNAGTEIRTRLRLRSTVRGANNRLDIDAIVSYDRGGGAPIPMLENAEGGGEDEGMPERQYKRGLAPYVFVPWEHIQDSPLNLPIAKMDFYVPG